MLFLLLGCTTADVTALTDARTPEERLDAALPGLAAAVAAHTEDLDAVADVVERADTGLVRLLLPPAPGGEWTDPVDGGEVDLRSASVRWEGGELRGSVRAAGVERGAKLWVDLRGGPAPDLQLRLGREGVRAARMRGWSFSPEEAVPGEVRIEGDRLEFAVPWAVEKPGAVTAVVEGSDGADSGPAGLLGPAPADAVATLVALVAPTDPDAVAAGTTAGGIARRVGEDPDLTLSVALAYGALRGLVAPSARPTVERDARERLAYGLELDGWLERQGARWRLGRWPASVKLLWAWPAGENVVYGALPLAWEVEPLSLEGYRYHAPPVDDLRALRDLLPLHPELELTALDRDDQVWEEMTYRAKDAGMAALCDARALDASTCFAWETDRKAGQAMGPVDGRPIPLHEATSVALQVERWREEGDLIGDCTTATTVAMAALQAVGIAPLAVGYAGPDWYWPTHNQPLFFDGTRFVPTQGMPGRSWDAERTWVYAVVPPVAGAAALPLGLERSGWARGGSVPGGNMPYGTMGAALEEGVTPGEVAAWIASPYARAWPELILD